MKRTILTGILALVAGAALLMAQAARRLRRLRRRRPHRQDHVQVARRSDRPAGLIGAQNAVNPDANAKADAIIAAGEEVVTKFPPRITRKWCLPWRPCLRDKGDAVKEQVTWGACWNRLPTAFRLT